MSAPSFISRVWDSIRWRASGLVRLRRGLSRRAELREERAVESIVRVSVCPSPQASSGLNRPGPGLETNLFCHVRTMLELVVQVCWREMNEMVELESTWVATGRAVRRSPFVNLHWTSLPHPPRRTPALSLLLPPSSLPPAHPRAECRPPTTTSRSPAARSSSRAGYR